jgi:RNA polymerase sigma-70 factor (ECF subfamily)
MQALITNNGKYSMAVEVQQQSDKELVRSACGGDRAAFDALVGRYCKPLTEFAAYRTGTVQDAEDIVQETFLRAYLNLKSYKPEYSLKNWLFTIAYRLIVSQYRKKKPLPLNEQFAATLAAEPEKTESQGHWLWKLVGKLNPEDHDILWLRYKQDMGVDEIAGVIGKTKIAVRVQLHRARKRLAKQVQLYRQQSETFAGSDCCPEGI